MKNEIKSLFVLMFVFLLTNCGESESSKVTNQYLGEAPGFAQDYTEKITDIEKDAKGANSLSELEDHDKKRKELNKEAEEKFDDIIKSLNLPKKIPFEVQQKDEKYEVNNLEITNLLYNQVELTADITSKVTRTHIFGYLQAVDEQGNPLESSKDWVVLDVNQWRNVKEGEPAFMKGYFRGVEKLENLEKFVFKTRKEYEKNK